MNEVKYLDRFISPSKVVCVGRNYVEHIKELGNEIPDDMVVFIKPNSAIASTLKTQLEPIHYEAELCFLVEKGQFVGVGIGLDLTKRELQTKLRNKGLPWERAKAFDGSAVFSHFVTLPENANELSFELSINDALVQQGDINLMMYRPDTILAEIKKFMTFADGDVVMTGTPKGVGVVSKEDQFDAKVLYQGETIINQQWKAV